ncbi:MAG: hypothetical protein R3C05_21270, partial [Pirellulaceae bacterium]
MRLPQSLNPTSPAITPWIAFVAVIAFILVVATWILWRRRGARRPKTAIACGVLSIVLHVGLFWFVPAAKQHGSGNGEASGDIDGTAPVMVTVTDLESFDPDQPASLDTTPETFVPPLELPEPLIEPIKAVVTAPESPSADPVAGEQPPDLSQPSESFDTAAAQVDQLLSELLLADASDKQPEPMTSISQVPEAIPQDTMRPAEQPPSTVDATPPSASGIPIPSQMVATPIASVKPDDFANRRGPARRSALIATGGDDRTEAAVAAGLRFIASRQRADGIWDPTISGAGLERAVLGHNRDGAGKRAETGITGLALLALMGSGHTHLEGPYADNVAR